jgi:hypothetical protein
MNGLSDEELAIVMALAQPLHPHHRWPFLQAVIEEATKHAEHGPGLISRLAATAQKSFFFGNRLPATGPGPGGATRQQHARRR